MKKALLIFALAAAVLQAGAQQKKPVKKHVAKVAAKPAPVVVKQKDESFSVLGKNFLDPGVGLGTFYKGLPFGIAYEHGFTDAISGGVFADYSSYNYPDFGYKLNIIYAGVRASYHFAKLLNVTNAKFDPYAGVSAGYYNVSFNGTGFVSPYSSAPFVGVQVGARYMFSDNIGGFAEAGYGVSALKVGLSFKF